MPAVMLKQEIPKCFDFCDSSKVFTSGPYGIGSITTANLQCSAEEQCLAIGTNTISHYR